MAAALAVSQLALASVQVEQQPQRGQTASPSVPAQRTMRKQWKASSSDSRAT